jgi:hypothetical protein
MNAREKKEYQLVNKVFARFLKEKNIYHRYVRGFSETNSTIFTPNALLNYVEKYCGIEGYTSSPIDYGLYWTGTEEGHEYWRELNNEWTAFRDKHLFTLK